MSSSTKHARILTLAGMAIGVVAVVAAAIAGLTGWPPAIAAAAPAQVAPTVLGVDADTAVALGPEVDAADKFDASDSAVLAGYRPMLVKTAAKAKAPVARRVVRTGGSVARGASVSRGSSGRGWKSARVSWYGPGFYGNGMAGGGKLTRTSMVVAHRSLPFGTRVQFTYHGRTCIAVVKDRGPFVGGRTFDLGPGTAKALGFSGVGTVKYRILGR